MSGPGHFLNYLCLSLTFLHISPPSPPPRPCPPSLRSRRRASINPLAQKKAAQRRDAKLTQLLAQNDEVRDGDFLFSCQPSKIGEGVGGGGLGVEESRGRSKGEGGRAEEGMERRALRASRERHFRGGCRRRR